MTPSSAVGIRTPPATAVRRAAQGPWTDEQKTRLKMQRVGELLETLRAHLEDAGAADGEAPVRQCHRYLSQRADQLHYQSAIERGLPIGSGEIESAHRYIVQQRLKRPGAWWCATNAEHMLALRLNRANRRWECVLGERFETGRLIYHRTSV